MKGYIEACVGRVIAAVLSEPALQRKKSYDLGEPVCLVAGVDTRYPGGLSRTGLVEEWGVIDEERDRRSRYTLLCVQGNLEKDAVGSLGIRVTVSEEVGYPRYDLAYHCEHLVSPAQTWLHDFTCPFRYRWYLPRPDGQSIYLEEIDYVLFHLIHMGTAIRFLPGLVKQLGVLGGCEETWVNHTIEMLLTLHEKKAVN